MELILSLLVGPVVVLGVTAFYIVRDNRNRDNFLDNSGSYLDEHFYTHNEQYNRYDGGDYASGGHRLD